MYFSSSSSSDMEAAFAGTGTAAGVVTTAAAATAEADGAADAARLSPASASAAASDEPRTTAGQAQPTHRASDELLVIGQLADGVAVIGVGAEGGVERGSYFGHCRMSRL